MKIRNLLLLLLSLAVLTGCFRPDDLKLQSVNGAEIVEVNGDRAQAVVTVVVENLSGPIVIKRGEIILSDKAKRVDICRAELGEKVRLERGVNEVKVPVTVYFSGGMFGLMRLAPILKGGNTDNLYLNGSFGARKGIVHIKRNFSEPLNNLNK